MARKNDMQRIADCSAKIEAASPEYTTDQKLAARTLIRRDFFFPMAAISAGGTLARTASPYQWEAKFPGRLLDARFIPSAAATANDTNTQTIQLQKGSTSMASLTVNTAAGNLVAGTSKALTLDTTVTGGQYVNQRFVKGDVLGPAVLAVGTGLAIGAGTLQITVELEGSMSDFPI